MKYVVYQTLGDWKCSVTENLSTANIVLIQQTVLCLVTLKLIYSFTVDDLYISFSILAVFNISLPYSVSKVFFF